MNCETVSEMLPELLAGALDRDTELETLAHLARCEGCRRELAVWAQVQQQVLQGVEEAPAGLVREVRANLFGFGVASVLEGIRVTGRALGLAGSACRLAFSAAGLK